MTYDEATAIVLKAIDDLNLGGDPQEPPGLQVTALEERVQEILSACLIFRQPERATDEPGAYPPDRQPVAVGLSSLIATC